MKKLDQGAPMLEQSSAIYEDEIDLRELFLTLWAAKWLIAGITSVFIVGSVVVALSLPNIYRAEVLLAPAAQEESAGALSGLANQFGGLASLAGVNLGGGSAVDKTTLALETIKSRLFLEPFVTNHQALVPLFAVKEWRQSNNELVIDSKIYDTSEGQWLREVDPPKMAEPSVQETQDAFNEILSITQDSSTGLISIAIEHRSPYVASNWVTWLVEDVNSYMKQRDIAEAQKSISFLERQIDQTSVAEMRQMLFGLIQEQTRTITLAEVRDEYVLRTVDPAVPPEKRASPNRKLIVIVGTLLGGMLACLFVLLRQAFRPEKVES